MTFGQAVNACFSKYVTFSGRAGRSEYWYWVLFTAIAAVVLLIIDRALPHHVLQPAFEVATFLPGLAVLIRRLHDIDRNGWWWLIAFIPLVGVIVLLVWLCRGGSPGPNRFGPATA
jgi:uncharacterized membrane protein YhaH (DUF805 family)